MYTYCILYWYLHVNPYLINLITIANKKGHIQRISCHEVSWSFFTLRWFHFLQETETEDFIFCSFIFDYLVWLNIFHAEMCYDLLYKMKNNGSILLGSESGLWKTHRKCDYLHRKMKTVQVTQLLTWNSRKPFLCTGSYFFSYFCSILLFASFFFNKRWRLYFQQFQSPLLAVTYDLICNSFRLYCSVWHGEMCFNLLCKDA